MCEGECSHKELIRDEVKKAQALSERLTNVINDTPGVTFFHQLMALEVMLVTARAVAPPDIVRVVTEYVTGSGAEQTAKRYAKELGIEN